ncbi:MAG: M15 family metallopeptidase [Cyanobacteriota bacterium]|nr:M15 family metallopeptidase [Cyanobacteriota bacterium]
MQDDIPEALRDPAEPLTNSAATREQWIVRGLIGLVSLGILALAGSLFWVLQGSQRPTATSSAQTEEASETSTPNSGDTSGETATDDLLGHFPYDIAPVEELEPIVGDGSIMLRQAAADRYLEMEAAARDAGIFLAPISGFRTLEDQEFLFFEVKAERRQGASERAEVSAPPGYSEHHTGYAIDIGDGNVPATHLSPDFENTEAFRWLEENAPYYSFELSFGPGNPQGVAYEPWHWRFVGDRDSLETFYKAREASAVEPELEEPLN